MRPWVALLIFLAGCGGGVKDPSGKEEAYLSLPTAALFYGSPGRQTRPPAPGNNRGYVPLEEAARYDLLVLSQHLVDCRYWINPSWTGSDCLLRLKEANPRLRALIYRMGPGAVKVSDRFGPDNRDWEWIKAHHGATGPERWTTVGVETGDYLLNTLYPQERMMWLGQPSWQDFWTEQTQMDLAQRWPGADGVLADVMQYGVSYPGRWCPEARWNGQSCSSPDHPADYYANGAYAQEVWRRDLVGFLERAVPGLQPYWLGLNAWRTDPTYRDHLNRIGPFLAMDEASFYWSPHAASLQNWRRALDNLRLARGYRLLSMNVFTPVAGTPLDTTVQRLEAQDPRGTRGWEALWFALTSFLLGYNFDPQNPNGYFAFNASTNADEGVSYRDSYYLTEYSRLPSLGSPLGDTEELGGLFLRSFEQGWVLVNPSAEAKVYRPPRPVRVLHHDNFLEPLSAPLQQEVSLPPGRGVLLLGR